MSSINTLDGPLTILITSSKGSVKITERTAYALASMMNVKTYCDGKLVLPPVKKVERKLLKSLNRVRSQNAFVVHGIDSKEWAKLQQVLGSLNVGDTFSITEVD